MTDLVVAVEGIESAIDARLGELGGISDGARAAGEDLIVATLAVHADALRALVDDLRACAGEDAVRRVAMHPAVGPVLALHDLHPVGLDARVAAAVDDAARALGSSSAARLLAVDGTRARVEVADAARGLGCGGPTRGAHVEATVLAAVPELLAVEVVAPRDAEPTRTWLPLPTLRAPRDPTPASAHDAEVCELCGTHLTGSHAHGVDVDQHRLVCVCAACRIVLAANTDGRGRFRALPERVVADPAFAEQGDAWDGIGIPVSTAFFFHDSVAGGIVAFYPSPAGATESLLGAEQWGALAAASPVAAAMLPDTEAMLVRRGLDARESYLVPIDRCYALVGLVRATWRGFDGGQEAHDAIDEFFAALRAECGASPASQPEVVGGA